jgi:hypothetical protein
MKISVDFFGVIPIIEIVMSNTTLQTKTGHVQFSVTKLESVLANHKGNGFAHIIAKTVPAMNKGGRSGTPVNPFHGDVFKIADVNIQAGFHYINSVNNQLTREGKEANADVKPRKWGQRIKGTPLVEHTNKAGTRRLYLEAKCESVNSVKYVDGKGNEIAKADLDQWLTSRPAKSSTQANVDKEIILRDYALDSIQWIAIDGEQINLAA